MDKLKSIFSSESCNACCSSPNIEMFNESNVYNKVKNFTNLNSDNIYNQDFDTYIAPYIYPQNSNLIQNNNLIQNSNLQNPIYFTTGDGQNIVLPIENPNIGTPNVYLKSEEINSPSDIFGNISGCVSCILCCCLLIYIISRIFKISW